MALFVTVFIDLFYLKQIGIRISTWRYCEVGQKPQSDPMKPAISRLPNQAARLAGTVPTATHTSLDEWLNSTAFNQTKEQITRTVYDLPYVNSVLCPLLCQQNLRNRVSYVQVFDVDPASLPATTLDKHQAATYYTYDISGNVTELLQDINQGPMASTGNRFKKLTYAFDLISGKVNEVAYQAGQPDEFYHRYLYDAENKITEVFTSSDYIKWDNDASYTYYKHGPLARTILGQQRVQGIDYAYTLQGWLKGVNSSSVITDGTTGQSINAGKFDMGKDGYYNSTNTNKFIARDVYSYQLNYFDGDYTPIGGANPFVKTGVHSLPATSGTTTQTMAKELYNGNIASMFVNIPKIGDAQLYGYQYDQLNRLVGMDAYISFSNHKNNWTGSTPTNLPSSGYQERISYDANGNILTYLRNGALGASGITMDNMSYQYSKDNTTGKLLSNQLRYVHDAASTSAYTTDIKNNAPIGINSKDDIDGEKLAVNQPGDNYQYDKIGNLIADKKEDIVNIEWTVYGKISTITKSNSSIQYTYDASGNRISKAVTTGGQTNYTYYVRDATGNVMSVYEKNSTLNGNLLTQSEVHLYGSSRLGVININRQAEAYTPGDEVDMGNFARGKKLYELTNHLGNVLVTISDKKIAGITGSLVPGVRNNPITHYMAEVVTANDYYPFGSQMPGRNFSQPNTTYRYGFNGKENDNEVLGSGNQVAYENRIYDPRLGRWLSVDPLQKKYPDLTPYNFSGNSPIVFGDYDGKDFGIIYDHKNKRIYIVGTYYVSKQEQKQLQRALNAWNKKTAKLNNGYTIQFSLKTKIPEMDNMNEFKEKNPRVLKLTKTEQELEYLNYVDNELNLARKNDPIGNAYYGSDYKDSRQIPSALGSGIGGETYGDYTFMNTADDGTDFGQNVELISHEIGHTVGLEDPEKNPTDIKPFHPEGGIMEYTQTGIQYPININDIKMVFVYAQSLIAYTVLKTLQPNFPKNKHLENRATVGMVSNTTQIFQTIVSVLGKLPL